MPIRTNTKLSTGEKNLLRDFFNDPTGGSELMDYDEIDVFEYKSPVNTSGKNNPHMVGGDMYFPTAYGLSDDYTFSNIVTQSVFVHEAWHIAQLEHPGSQEALSERKKNSVGGKENRDYTPFIDGTIEWQDLAVEAQAEFMEDLYILESVLENDLDPADYANPHLPLIESFRLSEALTYEEVAAYLRYLLNESDYLTVPISGGSSRNNNLMSDQDADGTGLTTDTISDIITAAFATIETFASPLVFDFGTSGIDLIDLNSSGFVYWDGDSDGIAEASGWIGSSEGFLAIDINSNGQIDSNDELFGSNSSDGFYDLSLLDCNNDGQIDDDDIMFGDLLVWRDLDTDGYTDAGELKSLSEESIKSIALASTRTDTISSGNLILSSGTFVYDDDSVGIIQDIWFQYNNRNTISSGAIPLDDRVQFLPEIRGYGDIHDLSVAMSISNGAGGLIEDVAELSSESLADLMSESGFMGSMRQIMHRWANVDGVIPNSRGYYVDARDLEFLEMYVGRPFLQAGYLSDPGVQAGKALTKVFFDAEAAFTARLLLQADGTALFSDTVTYDLASDTFTDPGTLSVTALADLEDVASDVSNDALDVWTNVLFFVTGVRGGDQELTTADINALDTAITNSDASLSFAEVHANLYGIEAGSLDLNGTGSGETLIGSSYGDQIEGDAGDDTLYGNGGDDYIATGSGNDITYGGAGHDEIYNYSGNDTFYGGTGADLFRSGTGNDTYVFEQGDGDDTIVESWATSATDKIQFGSGITISDLTFTRVSNEDLLITISSTVGGGSILVDGHFKNYAEDIELIVFADTSTFNPESINYTLHGIDVAESLNGVFTGSDDDTIYGHGGNDWIFGYQGADNLYGGDGDDTIYAYDTSGENSDTHAHTLDGGAGNDLIKAADGNDTITGGTGNDSLFGFSGNDTYLFAYGDGNDTIADDAGTDKIELGAGIVQGDLSYSVVGADLVISIDGGAGGRITITNQFYGTTNRVETLVLYDTTVIDLLYEDLGWVGTSGNDNIYGRDFTTGIDTIHGLAGNDNIYGYQGVDILYGDDGNDYIEGGYGNDELYGGSGVDNLRGGYGEDILDGGDGNDDVRGGENNDILSGGLGDDYIDGEGGNDTVDYSGSASAVVIDLNTRTVTGEGTDTLYSIEIAKGSAHDDTLIADYYSVGLDGGDGIDTLDLMQSYGPGYSSTINLAAGTSSGYGTTFWLANIENVIGRSGNDTITGSSGANKLEGRDGNDTLIGGGGDDLLLGGNGSDTLSGGTGADTFRLLNGESGTDTIADFNTGQGDVLDLADLLDLFDPMSDVITDFVEITTSGSNSLVKVDADGGANNFVLKVTLNGVTGLTDEAALVTSGNLLVA
ncbi:type I secretion C-terminal target domain-containing protein [Paracoccus sp. M683]|uniref:calcium-binding protein n=1 Tax=Paracoccus sp. M683 TaxID=2594268 RepID=UPI0011806FA2|nr:calcium-binding protein [Paracoccus sp. M683]TRW96279.1 type I secretion C-terminal target domain-containing protein [Paracoccus sp. M683]